MNTVPSHNSVQSLTTHKRALLVDDVDYNLMLLESWLEPLGFDVTYASNLAEARKALKYVPFHVVFLDNDLPDGYGYNFASEIATSDILPRPAVIAMTASDESDTIFRFFRGAAQAFMSKPLDLDLVCECLRECHLLDEGKLSNVPARAHLHFENIHFMSRGDDSLYVTYLERLDKELDSEIAALYSACFGGVVDQARTICHRILSLAPLVQSSTFTSVIKSCQQVARQGDATTLRQLGQALLIEHRFLKGSLQDAFARIQTAQTPLQCKTA